MDATIKALESFPANIHLILGGKDKGSDYTVLNDLLRQRVKRVYTIGAAAAKIESQIQGAAEIEHAETLENAVRRASESAVRGRRDSCWLRPAPASISFRVTSIGGGCLRRRCIRWRWLDRRSVIFRDVGDRRPTRVRSDWAGTPGAPLGVQS